MNRRYSDEELRQEAVWRKCSKDAAFFMESYWKIKHPTKGAILMEMREAQKQTLDVWLNKRMSIALKARQIGFSTLAGGLMFWHVFFHEDRSIIALSKTEKEAQELKSKIDYGLLRIPAWMLARGPKVKSDNLSKLDFTNGSSIEAFPANDPARGRTAYLIIVDEWAHFENPEKAWAAIEPATDIGGSVICLSSANGAGNMFEVMFTAAKAGTNGFTPIFHSWRAVPERNDAWYETKKRNMLEWQLHQEYPSTAEEAFIKSGNPVFNVDQLNMLLPELPMRGWLRETGFKTSEFEASDDGPLRMWEAPQQGTRYVIGADVAEGLEHGDWSVAHVISTVTGKVVAKWKGHVEPDLFGSEILWHLGWYYNYALVGPEANNHGHATLAFLNSKGYGNIYMRHAYDERSKKRSKKLGWYTSGVTKPLAIDELAAALRMVIGPDGEIIEPPAVELLDGETIFELIRYVRDAKGGTHGSPFDDEVMSLAIANQMLKHYSTPEQQEEEDSEFTLDWWLAQATNAHEAPSEWTVGAHSGRAA